MNTGDLVASYADIDPFADMRIRELSSLMKFENARVLDIGFGRAQFLHCLAILGATPFGLELDTQAIELAGRLGIDTFTGDVVDFVTEHEYDLISLLDFVEHPLHPMDTLQRAAELLAPRGLLVLWTPNGDVADLEDDPIVFRVDLEHMQYFTPDTCLFAASELRLRIVHLETVGFPVTRGIDKPLTGDDSPLRFLERKMKHAPWFNALDRLRCRLVRAFQDEAEDRTGVYNLFCIMQKVE